MGLQTRRRVTILLLGAKTLTGCGGTAQYASIGGAVTGLQASGVLILQNNKADDLVLTQNQSLIFTTPVSIGKSYDVSVSRQPLGRTCVVSNGLGIVNPTGDPVASIGVRCTITASVVGLVVGLRESDGPSTLSLNGIPLTISNSGFAEFPGVLAPASAYNVSVVQQPSGVTCNVGNASGVIAENVLTYVQVGCTRPISGPQPIG